jgi:hypothetical protein
MLLHFVPMVQTKIRCSPRARSSNMQTLESMVELTRRLPAVSERPEPYLEESLLRALCAEELFNWYLMWYWAHGFQLNFDGSLYCGNSIMNRNNITTTHQSDACHGRRERRTDEYYSTALCSPVLMALISHTLQYGLESVARNGTNNMVVVVLNF